MKTCNGHRARAGVVSGRLGRAGWRVAVIGAAMLGVGQAEVSAVVTSSTFMLIADTNTQVPGSSDTFSAFRVSLGATGFENFIPSIHDKQVAFRALYPQGQSGIFTHTGSLAAVVTTGTAIPDGIGNFTGFRDPVIHGGHVAFNGFGDAVNDFQAGIYTTVGGLNRVVDRTTQMPDLAQTFDQISRPSFHDGNVAFWGRAGGSGPQGVFTNVGGSLATVANTTTPNPADAFNVPFNSLGPPKISGSNVVFPTNFFDAPAVVADFGTGLVAVASRTTPVPGGIGNFDNFNQPNIDGTDVGFIGGTFVDGPSGVLQRGIYSTIGGLHAIVDLNTPVPDGGTFQFFGNPVLDAGNVAFLASTTSGEQGIYLHTGFDSTLSKVVTVGDVIDSKTVAELSFGSEGFHGSSLAFFARFTDQTHGIYRVDLEGVDGNVIPEPATAALAAMSVLALAGRVCGRRRGV